MGRNQADTFQCSLLINIQQLIRACALAGQLLVASFFISCVKRLWDSVGHFLGHRRPSRKPLSMRAAWLSEGVQCQRNQSRTQVLI